MSAHARMTQVFLQDGYCDKPTTPRAVSTGPVHHGVGSAFLPGVRNGRTLDRHAAYAAAANVKRLLGARRGAVFQLHLTCLRRALHPERFAVVHLHKGPDEAKAQPISEGVGSAHPLHVLLERVDIRDGEVCRCSE